MLRVGDWETTITISLDPEVATKVVALLRRPEITGMIGLDNVKRSKGEITWVKTLSDAYCRDSYSAAFQAMQQLWDRYPTNLSLPQGNFTVSTKWVPA